VTVNSSRLCRYLLTAALGVSFNLGGVGLAPCVAADLTLDKYLAQVQAYYPKLRGADLQRQLAAAKTLEKAGAFDPVLYGGSEFNRYNSSSAVGKIQQAWISEAGLELPTRSGAKIGLVGKLNTGDVKSPFSPTGEGGEYGVQLKMPLLRGLLRNEKATEERQARLGETQANSEFNANLLETLQQAGQGYWDWVTAFQRLNLHQRFVQLADTRAGWIRTRAQAGDLPLIDEAEARQEVLRREGLLIKAKRDWQKAGFKLNLYRWQANNLPDYQAPDDPIPLPKPAQLAANIENQAIETALQHRPELVINRQEQAIVEQAYLLAKNQRLPEANLTVGPGIETGDTGAGFVMKAGVSVLAPLRQRAARGRMRQSELKLEKLKLDYAWWQRNITLQIQDALSALSTTFEQVQLAERELAFAQKLQAGEQVKFDLGDSTVFMLNQRERATQDAALKLLDLQQAYQVNKLTLTLLQGNL
jgi:outer membrane protein